jgi:hypothetical protein
MRLRLQLSPNGQTLRIKKVQEFLIISFTEPGTNTHVLRNRPRDVRRESFWRVMAAGTVLIEYLLPAARIAIASVSGLNRLLVLLFRILHLRDRRTSSEHQAAQDYWSHMLHIRSSSITFDAPTDQGKRIR